ncbi:alpha/beta hydrolase [Psychrobium sp. MM17-31]|uniref:alpha/beta hydrolase n=1 Tax=Psychrobium sp. MM17-31 TaxID=2917758 RepID=UPI001EF5FBDA|nr:alpha/beta hydrolase-fold protein [Psychrobium sp. MM17-31]MCG7531073.1 alpha/beta hydrolase [Psychrobium sp. MM17-31]
MKILTAILLCFISTIANASNFTELKTPKSKYLVQAPKITIALPSSYEKDPTKKYPVFYVLDGELNGDLVDATLRRLHISNGANEHIVIGISSQNRLRDFAPTVNKNPRGPVGEGGGGDLFLDFIEKELMPQITRNYRTNGFNILAGHSIAGLLVVHSFQSRPTLFQSHLAFSPAVWWGARETSAAAKQYVTSGKQVPTYLYMAIGNEGGKMRDIYDSLTQTLVRNRHLNSSLLLDEFDNDSHDFTMVAGLLNALKGLFQYQEQRMK